MSPQALLRFPARPGSRWRVVFRAAGKKKAPDEEHRSPLSAAIRATKSRYTRGPFVSRLYAGRPRTLSLRPVPFVEEWEREYGHVLLRGAMKSRPAEGNQGTRRF